MERIAEELRKIKHQNNLYRRQQNHSTLHDKTVKISQQEMSMTVRKSLKTPTAELQKRISSLDK
jgi:hypothetical protein